MEQTLAVQNKKTNEEWNHLYEELMSHPSIKKNKELEVLITQALSKPNIKKTLIKIIYYSPYLYQCLRQDIPFLISILTKRPDDILKDLLDQVEYLKTEDNIEILMQKLRRAKKSISLLTGVYDLSGKWTLEDVTRSLSGFAERSVQAATCFLLRKAHHNGHIILPNLNDPEQGSGFIVLGIGKLGGYELNYSSDIDLIIVFDEYRVKTEHPENLSYAFVRMTRELIRILEERTPDGYVFRTDLRLRPDPGSTPLAVSFTAAEIYYGSLGQNWERAAMIKSRPLAGDNITANDFQKLMRSWIWRKNLDFATIQDIHSIKRQINTQSQKKKKSFSSILSYNVKLDHGGIREIEFFVQTQQLIYGGRNPEIRQPDTINALKALLNKELISTQAEEDLINAYGFLRNTEHRLQMIDDQQTHSLPSTPESLETFSKFMGYKNSDNFIKDLKKHVTLVKEHYKALFEESPKLSDKGNLVFTGTEDDPETLKTIEDMGFSDSSRISSIIRGWHHGRYQATHSNRARQILTEITPSLLKSFGQTAHPDEAFLHFDHFLGKLPTGIPIFLLFQAKTELMEVIAEIMGTAPSMAHHLSFHPEILDGLITQDYFGQTPNKEDLKRSLDLQLSTANDYQDILDLIRRWARDMRFQAELHILQSLSPIDECTLFLSNIADISLNTIFPHVQKEFEKKYGLIEKGEFAIIALGQMGAQHMAINSDLDLIAIYDCPNQDAQSNGDKKLPISQYYTRLMQRFISAVSAPTAEGKLYEIDMRLRPTGNAGPLAISLERFNEYHKKESWVWEHMSLLRARIILGNKPISKKIDESIYAILTLPRRKKELKSEVIEMYDRIQENFGTSMPWNLKYREGGLIDILFIIQFLQLLHAHKNPKVICRDTRQSLKLLKENKLISLDTEKELSESFNLLFLLRNFLRLSIEGTFESNKAPQALNEKLAEIAGTKNIKELENKIAMLTATTHKHYLSILKDKKI